MPDQDGYPTADEEHRIEHWPEWTDYPGLMALVKSCWWMADWGWHEAPYTDDTERGTEYRISTGGWSGNEGLIGILCRRPIGFWSQCWVSSRRGGHYVFRVETKA